MTLQFEMYRSHGSIKEWVETEGGPAQSQLDLFRVYTARCIDWMNAFNAAGHTLDDWKVVYKYWLV